MVSAAYTDHPAAQLAAFARLAGEQGRAFAQSFGNGGNHVLPADVVETADELRFVLEVPGLRAEDIEVAVENGILNVSAEKARAEGDSPASYRLSERHYGRVGRSFRLPRTADSSRIQASCEHGLLTIRVPRAEAARARRIEVSAAPATGNGATREVAGA